MSRQTRREFLRMPALATTTLAALAGYTQSAGARHRPENAGGPPDGLPGDPPGDPPGGPCDDDDPDAPAGFGYDPFGTNFGSPT